LAMESEMLAPSRGRSALWNRSSSSQVLHLLNSIAGREGPLPDFADAPDNGDLALSDLVEFNANHARRQATAYSNLNIHGTRPFHRH